MKLKCLCALPVVADGTSTKSIPLKHSGFKIIQEMDFFNTRLIFFIQAKMNLIKILAILRI